MLFLSQPSKKGICYYRHSKEDAQENSIEIQREQVHQFAKANNVQILQEFEDEMTGVTDQRPGFQKMMNEWVMNPDAPKIDCILVYDVSRWGRFRITNMGVHYAYECEQRGIDVVFSTLGFPPEGSGKFSLSLIIYVLSWQASNYSKELSVKVFNGSKKVSQQGFSAGGIAPYGYDRWLCEEVNKEPIRALKKGERKQIANDRVTFRPATDHTAQTVRRIFTLFAEKLMDLDDIANILNKEGILAPNGGEWHEGKVINILTNLTYTGSRVYNKTWKRLHQKSRRNPRSEWVITPNAHPAIVSRTLFDQAQGRLYWMSSWWRRGIVATNKVQLLVEAELTEWLIRNGYPMFQAEEVLYKFPVTYSVGMREEASGSHWCFGISEWMRMYESILCIGIDPDKGDPADSFFILPRHVFNASNFALFSETDETLKKYQISKERLPEQVLSLARQIKIKPRITPATTVAGAA